VSSSCSATIDIVPIEPATIAFGPAFLCDGAGLYKLDIDPPASSTVTWAVAPSNATTVSSGSGSSVYLSKNSSYHGYATITFTVSTSCGNATRSYKFFVGTPTITGSSVDGLSGNFVNICPSAPSHYIIVSFVGDQDSCVTSWDDHGSVATSYSNCHEFDFTLKYNGALTPPYECAFITCLISNDCGTSSQNFLACPSYNACRRSSNNCSLVVSPNPASTEVYVQLRFDDAGKSKMVELSEIEIISSQGRVFQKQIIKSAEGRLDVSKLENGLYYLRTLTDQGYVMEQLIINN